MGRNKPLNNQPYTAAASLGGFGRADEKYEGGKAVFHEFKEPYYALIKGELINHNGSPMELTSVRVYEENVAKLEGITDSMKLRSAKGRYVYDDEALHLFAKCLEDKSFSEAKRLFNALPNNSLVILDQALL